MKHKCGHSIDIDKTTTSRLSENPAINQLLMEVALAEIPCYECLCEEYKRCCFCISNDDGTEIIIAGMPKVRGGTHRQGAYAHLIRHVLVCSGLASIDQRNESGEWIDLWNSMMKADKPEISLADLIENLEDEEGTDG